MMATIRPIVLATGEIYHIFNRGVEKRDIFTNTKEYKRAIEVMKYYRYKNPFPRYSQFINLDCNRKNDIIESLSSKNQIEIRLFAYCLMPNHFHFILRQEIEGGISRFLSNFSNSYGKYFNQKHERVGPLFQGPFKAVRVEDDEQFVHLSRYIHLNPLVSFLIKERQLDDYIWSSFRDYLNKSQDTFVDKSFVMSHFKDAEEYRKFVYDHIGYAKEIGKIKKLLYEE